MQAWFWLAWGFSAIRVYRLKSEAVSFPRNENCVVWVTRHIQAKTIL
jgi:hypothetical protein